MIDIEILKTYYPPYISGNQSKQKQILNNPVSTQNILDFKNVIDAM